jgi:transketolase
MRTHFFNTLLNEAENHSNIVLLTGDLGFGVLEAFEEKFPERFINAGVAEQNMLGVATGLALSGKVCFTYSIGNFGTLRCLEQIRNDVCYHDANVNIITVGTGFSYGQLGISHHSTEDISILSAIPNLKVFSPGEGWEVEACTKAMCQGIGPSYLRLDKSISASSRKENEEWVLGKARLLYTGSDITLVTTGGILSEVLAAATELFKDGIQADVLHYPTIIPFDAEQLIQSIQKTKKILVVEEQILRGGLGSMVAEVVLESPLPFKPAFERLGLKNEFSSVVGDQAFLRKRYGVDKDSIIQCAKRMLNP